MIEISHISVTVGTFKIKNLSLTVPEGSYTGIIGSSGAGKTILLETIAGLIPVSEGTISMNGRQITHLHPKDRNIGMVYQDLMLFPHMNVFENIAFGLRLRKEHEDAIARTVAQYGEMMHISHLMHQFPSTLSGGEQQRVALVRALVLDPVLLLLDEPFSALDLVTRQHLRFEVHQIHKKTRTTIIQITHHFEDIWPYIDNVVLMKEGEIEQTGPPSEIFRHPSSSFAATFTGIENIFTGFAQPMQDKSIIDSGDISIISSSCCQGDVTVTIRSEDILVSLSPVKSMSNNLFRGVITRITSLGSQYRVEVFAGLPFVSLMSNQSYSMLGMKEGDIVFITFSDSHVNVIPEKRDDYPFGCSVTQRVSQYVF
jgi:ABC-type Fe3+/spermidine/putrescine transport system ATPase subunit